MKNFSAKRLISTTLAGVFIAASLTACSSVTTEEVKAQRLAFQKTVTCSVEKKWNSGSRSSRHTKIQTSCGELRIKKDYSLEISRADAKALANTIEVGNTYDFTTVESDYFTNVISATVAAR